MKTFDCVSDWLFPIVFLACWIWLSAELSPDPCAGRGGVDICAIEAK